MRPIWPTLVLAACLSPTEVTIRLTSDACDSIAETDIFLGDSTTANASTSACPQIGSLVMIPSGTGPDARDAKFTVRVNACDKGKAHCIKASRRVGYIPHTPLELPISLDRSCMDVTCPLEKTCVQGACVPNDVICTAGQCNPAPSDAGLVCKPPYVNVPPNGAPTIAWHFDDASPHRDAFMQCEASQVSTTTGKPDCGNALFAPGAGGGQTFPLACGANALAAGTDFHVALWFEFVGPSTLVTKGTAQANWQLWVDGTNTLAVSASIGPNRNSFEIGPTLTPGWHSVELHFFGGMVATWVDGNPYFSGSLSVPTTPTVPITIGPLNGGRLDELYIDP